MSESEQKSWLEDLRDRRFFRFVLSYIIAGWGLIQFTDWMSKRYGLASSWVDLLIILLLALLPSVILFTYYHGRPGKDRWTKTEKIFIPANLVLAIALVAFMFSGNAAGATSEKVTVQDEKGTTIERYVPKQEYLQRLCIFPLELDASLKEEQWLRLTVPQLLNYDLQQDQYLFTPSPNYLKSRYENRDVDFEEEAPFSIKRKIAEDSYADHFITGKISKAEGNYTLHLKTYTAKDGKLLSEIELSDSNLLELIDQSTAGILEDIHLLEVRNNRKAHLDLPVADIFSNNLEALEYFANAYQLGFLDNKTSEALTAFKKAVELDPGFTLAYRYMARTYLRDNLLADAKSSIGKALDGADKLPELVQFDIRYQYYRINQESDKAIALLEMWQQLYPNNFAPYANSMQIHAEQNNFEKAKEVGLLALEKGHGAEILITLANLSSLQGNKEEAIKYYQTFADRYPQRAAETSELGAIYLLMGEDDKAEKHFDKLALLKPKDFRIIGRLGELAVFRAQYDEAEKHYQRSLELANSASDSAEVYQWMYFYRSATGQSTKAIEHLEDRWEALASFRSPFEIGVEKLSYNIILDYINGGFEDQYLEVRDGFLNSVPDQGGIFSCVADINYAIAIKDSTYTNEVMERCAARLAPIIGELSMKMIYGFQEDVNGNYDEALALFEDYFEGLQMEDQSIRVLINGEIYIRSKRFTEAVDLYSQSIETRPNYAIYHLNLAKAYIGLDKKAEARTAIQRTLELLEKADENNLHLMEAEKLAKELGL